MPLRHLLAAAVGLVLSTGCVTMGTMQTAHTIGAGNTQFALEPSLWGGVGGGAGVGLPMVAVSGRYGVNDHTDLGFRIGTNGGDVLTKFKLVGGGPGTIVISLAPAAGGFFAATGGGGAGSMMFQVPLLIGIPVGSSELVLGPKIHDWYIGGGSGSGNGGVNLFSVGASVGFAIRAGNTFQIMPELTLLKPTNAHAGATGTSGVSADLMGTSGLLMQAGVGLLFGGN